MSRSVLGSRAAIGGVLGSGRGGAAAAWYLAGGVSAANCIAAYAPIGAASLAASYDNIAAPGNGLADGTYDAAPGAAPTFDTATGWTFNGLTQYLTTGIIPSAVSWSALCRFSNGGAVAAYQGLLGAYDTSGGTHRFVLYQRNNTTLYGVGNDGTLTASGTMSSGVLGFAGANGYRDGSAMSGTISPNTTATTARIIIGAYHDGTSWAGTYYPGGYFPGKIQALAIYNATLSAAQVAAISSAMASL